MRIEEPDPFLIPSRWNDHTSTYAARMVYMVDDQEHPYNGPIPDSSCRSLKPPSLFMSRRQAKVDAALQRGVTGGTRTRRAAKAGEETTRQAGGPSESKPEPAHSRRNKRQLQTQINIPIVELDNSSKNDWRLVRQAGIRFWLNSKTGEATDECPHVDLLQMKPSGESDNLTSTGKLAQSLSRKNEVATGSPIYDGREFEEAMRLLDRARPLKVGA